MTFVYSPGKVIGMESEPAIVPGMAEAIERRRRELGLTPGDFIKATGLTGPGLSPLRKGVRKRYQERLTNPVCRVLRWTPDSIDRLLRGDPAVVLDAAPPTEADRRLAESMLSVLAQMDPADIRTVTDVTGATDSATKIEILVKTLEANEELVNAFDARNDQFASAADVGGDPGPTPPPPARPGSRPHPTPEDGEHLED